MYLRSLSFMVAIAVSPPGENSPPSVVGVAMIEADSWNVSGLSTIKSSIREILNGTTVPPPENRGKVRVNTMGV